jgi:hypothetical protein
MVVFKQTAIKDLTLALLQSENFGFEVINLVAQEIYLVFGHHFPRFFLEILRWECITYNFSILYGQVENEMFKIYLLLNP